MQDLVYDIIIRIGMGTKCLKNQPCDVTKMREMRGEVGKKTLTKKMVKTLIFDDTWPIF